MQQSKAKNRLSNKNSHGSKKSHLRIIGGKYRGRKLVFNSSHGLRPTLDRIRETLFNWLSADIQNSICLDLFSGSGALGLEALSRGAKEVVFVDTNTQAINNILSNLTKINANNESTNCVNTSAEKYLKTNDKVFDLIFIDPPYNQDLINPTLKQISPFIHPDSLVYIEMESEIKLNEIEENWEWYKQKSTNRLHYGLVKRKE